MHNRLAVLAVVAILGACGNPDVVVTRNAPVTGSAAPVPGCAPMASGANRGMTVFGDQGITTFQYSQLSSTPTGAGRTLDNDTASPDGNPNCP